jgi:MYXO-CTERM domain-containing protein
MHALVSREVAVHVDSPSVGPGVRLAFLSALIIVGLGRPAVSEACTGPAYGPALLAPDDGSTGVPWDEADSRRWELPPGTHTLHISARDLAGNESSPTEVTVSAECPGGCSASSDAGPAGWLAGLMLLGFAARPSRRPRKC